ncbi:MAG TPA: tetratricopeptide repeat protein, partial [Sphingobium sp.]|nr:tetratricopeptide repeat protein [Sphingobium sp.]
APVEAAAPAEPPRAVPGTNGGSTGAPSEARKTAVAAIERPSTGDAAADAYSYGYRLWDAKFYPEAQAQLKATVDKFGTTSVASRAANLLGRAYLDDGKPALASVAFYENYQKRPKGDRAAESLAYLGEALIQLKKPADACKVYAELDQVYGASLSASQRGLMDRGRAKAKCS